MNAVVFEHVPVAELPEKWRAQLNPAGHATVTVRIEQEAVPGTPPPAEDLADDPLFGMWRDRDDLADVASHIRRLRASRFTDEGTPPTSA